MTLMDRNLPLLCDAFVRFLSPFGEAVVHDMTTQKIRYIAGNLSNRQPGDPSFLEELNPSAQPHRVIGPYCKTAADGRFIKSVSVLLRGAPEETDLLLCLNMDASHFEAAREALTQFISSPPHQPENPFADDWLEKLNRFIARWSLEQTVAVKGMTPGNRKRLLEALQTKGVFARPKAAIAIAAALGVSRATIYQDLKALDHGAAHEKRSHVSSSSVAGAMRPATAPLGGAERDSK